MCDECREDKLKGSQRGKNLRDLTGQVFDKLTVLSRAEDHIEKGGRARVQWLCQCTCGETLILKSRQLLRGTVTCCDSCRPTKRRIVHKHNLVNKKFGKWTVLGESPNTNKGGHTKWICRCDCGTVREVDGGHLVDNTSTSCGCTRAENSTAVDLTNKKFGRWTAKEKVGKDKYNNWLWKCVCECGSEGILTANSLLSNKRLSCGCLKREKTHARRENLVGRKFNMLTVIEQVEDHVYPNGKVRQKYKCRCECGQEVIVTSNALKSGATKSCGCLSSQGERRLSEILNENRIKYKKQKSYKDLLSDKGNRLRFDFYIPSGNYLIEFDGMYHFEASKRIWCTEEHVKKTQYHDKLKNEYCRRNNIPLIRIPYTQLSSLSIDDLRLETTKFRVV